LIAKTLADVIAGISRAELPNRRRQELKSALHTVARALGRRLEDVPADPPAANGPPRALVAIGISRGDGRTSSAPASSDTVGIEVGRAAIGPPSPPAHVGPRGQSTEDAVVAVHAFRERCRDHLVR
jgi:hypothetical protein